VEVLVITFEILIQCRLVLILAGDRLVDLRICAPVTLYVPTGGTYFARFTVSSVNDDKRVSTILIQKGFSRFLGSYE